MRQNVLHEVEVLRIVMLDFLDNALDLTIILLFHFHIHYKAKAGLHG